jgi:hypothetical protein
MLFDDIPVKAANVENSWIRYIRREKETAIAE